MACHRALVRLATATAAAPQGGKQSQARARAAPEVLVAAAPQGGKQSRARARAAPEVLVAAAHQGGKQSRARAQAAPEVLVAWEAELVVEKEWEEKWKEVLAMKVGEATE